MNFDNFDRLFGVLPGGEVGFMQNNKWDYPYVKASEEQWAKIKGLLILAVENTTRDTLEAVDVAIQGLIERVRKEGE